MYMHASFVHSILKIIIYKTLFIFFLNESLNTTRNTSYRYSNIKQYNDTSTGKNFSCYIAVIFGGKFFCTEMKLLIRVKYQSLMHLLHV